MTSTIRRGHSETVTNAACTTSQARARAIGQLALLAWCVMILAPSQAASQESLPPELQPYRVSLVIEFERATCFPPAFQSRIRNDFLHLLDRTVGERWALESVAAGVAPSFGRDVLHRMTSADVSVERHQPSGDDVLGFPLESVPEKLIFIHVSSEGPGYIAIAREWDRLTDTLGPIQKAVAVERTGIARAAVVATLDAFRPLAAIEEGDEARVSLAVRASGIPSPDPSSLTVSQGALFVPILRRFDRDGMLVSVQTVPHTLLEVADEKSGRLTASIHTALRSPLGTRRGRVEAWAIAAEPLGDTTQLTLVRREDNVPLSGRVVEVRFQAPVPGEEIPPADETLLTDRAGQVSLAYTREAPLVWITIKSGDATLLRFPLAPGIERQVSVPLGDDQRRIDAEGRLAILTGELIETVAKRATLMATARKGARTGRYDEADAALAEAAKLPDATSYRRRLAAIETPAAKAAEEDGDRLAAFRIRALGRKARDLIDRYLGTDALRATIEEVEELKKTDPDRATPKQ